MGSRDNMHLYDRLLPHLSPARRVVTFDFLGWGSSDKPAGYPYTTDNQVGDLDAVITQLGLGPVTLVAHDASGPPAIDWALANPEARGRAGVVEHVLLRNADAPASGGDLALLHARGQKRRAAGVAAVRELALPPDVLVAGRGFIRDADVGREFVPLLYQQFAATPSTQPAFFRLNVDLLPMVRSRNQKIPKMKEFRRPVRIIFGDADRSLNSGVARTFHEFFPGSELFLIPGAQHFVQLDEPEKVAKLILAMPSSGSQQA
jgi:pimeloyl-ACP methyl ester carboxylesterase